MEGQGSRRPQEGGSLRKAGSERAPASQTAAPETHVVKPPNSLRNVPAKYRLEENPHAKAMSVIDCSGFC